MITERMRDNEEKYERKEGTREGKRGKSREEKRGRKRGHHRVTRRHLCLPIYIHTEK